MSLAPTAQIHASLGQRPKIPTTLEQALKARFNFATTKQDE
jgi:hypothetical protein